MILGFLGKGGSGKSSVSSQMALFLNSYGKHVLAIDADHNMDLAYNLSGGEMPTVQYFSQSLPTFQHSVGLEEGQKYNEAFLNTTSQRFLLNPLATEIKEYSVELASEIRLMIAGPQTEYVLYGTHCSHSLTTPLKILLPLLELQENEIVVVDEKAGADGVSTGIITGIDVGVIVCEPAFHSIKTAKQIAELMDFYDTPYVFVGNKVTTREDQDFLVSELGQEPVVFLTESSSLKRNPSAVVPKWQAELKTITEAAATRNKKNRLERTVAKFKRNKKFEAAQ